MERIELQLDEASLERARRLAEAHRCSLEQLLQEIIERLGAAETDDEDWTRLTVEEFLKSYAESDAIHDR